MVRSGELTCLVPEHFVRPLRTDRDVVLTVVLKQDSRRSIRIPRLQRLYRRDTHRVNHAQERVHQRLPREVSRRVHLTHRVPLNEQHGRRPSNVTSLSPLGDSGHRILITNAAKRLQLRPGTNVCRRANLDVIVLIPEPAATETTEKRAQDVLDARETQLSGMDMA